MRDGDQGRDGLSSVTWKSMTWLRNASPKQESVSQTQFQEVMEIAVMQKLGFVVLTYSIIN